MWQPGLRKLYLVTDPDCEWNDHYPGNMVIPSIQEFSWKGLRHRLQCESVRDMLKSYHQQLTLLELDFADLQCLQYEREHIERTFPGQRAGPTPLVEMVLPCPRINSKDFLPKLRNLSISNAPLEGDRKMLMEAFNITKVKNLKLLKCSSTSSLLIELSETCLEARRLELTLTDLDEDHDMEMRLIYLAPFSALEDLFLMFDVEGDALQP